MEIDTVYLNVRNIEGTGGSGHQIPNPNRKEGKAKKRSVCLVLMSVSLGLICVLLLGIIMWMTISIAAERDLVNRHKYNYSFHFFVSNEEKNWSESRRFCRDRGADLVMIKTEEKQRFISSLVKERVWIGLTKSKTTGNMTWVDNSPLTKGFFLDGEPNNAGGIEDCVMMNLVPNPLNNWNDEPCSYTYKMICEK